MGNEIQKEPESNEPKEIGEILAQVHEHPGNSFPGNSCGETVLKFIKILRVFGSIIKDFCHLFSKKLFS